MSSSVCSILSTYKGGRVFFIADQWFTDPSFCAYTTVSKKDHVRSPYAASKLGITRTSNNPESEVVSLLPLNGRCAPRAAFAPFRRSINLAVKFRTAILSREKLVGELFLASCKRAFAARFADVMREIERFCVLFSRSLSNSWSNKCQKVRLIA